MAVRFESRTPEKAARGPGFIGAAAARWWLLVGSAGLAAAAACGGGDFEWRSAEDHVALVQPDGTAVWQFNHPPAPTKPHFHPVGLPGGEPMTWLAPPDHPWHLGMWFSWKYINGRNYWEVDGETGRSEGLTRAFGFRSTLREDFSARLELEVAYQPDEDSEAHLHELRVIEVSAPADDGSYHFDWTMNFTAADEPVLLERTPVQSEPESRSWGGYAGLIWRFAREFSDWQVVTDAGDRDLESHGARATACDFSGRINRVASGVAIIEHPESLRSPTSWYVTLDHDTPFACVMPAPLFRSSYWLAAGESFTLRYRVIVHPGRWDVERLKAERALSVK